MDLSLYAMHSQHGGFQRVIVGSCRGYSGIMEKTMETLGPFKRIYRAL